MSAGYLSPRALTTPAQLDPESNHTSIVSVPLTRSAARDLYASGKRSSIGSSHHASVPFSATMAVTCAMVSAFISGSSFWVLS